jgi:hypothetical protein
MNVKELKELLDDYGDHLPVIVRRLSEGAESEEEFTELAVDYGHDEDGDPAVVIEV